MSKEVIKKKSKGKHWRGVKVSVVDFTKFTDLWGLWLAQKPRKLFR